MNENRNERLSDALAGTDDRLLAKAWDTDSPEKLRGLPSRDHGDRPHGAHPHPHDAGHHQ